MRGLVCLLVALLAVAPAAGAQVFRYLAFGDSMTEGFNDSASCSGCNPDVVAGGCGYSSSGITRLPALLGCTGTNCQVVNHGLSFETSAGGLTRLGVLLSSDSDWEVMILMEGSNDLFDFTPVPAETVRDNLKKMGYEAAELGIDTLHASVIRFHRFGDWGTSRDALIDSLGSLVAAVATDQNRTFADQRKVLCGDLTGVEYASCQDANYCEDEPGDPDPWVIGHPGPSGFDLMSTQFSDVITASGLPAAPTPTAPTGAICDATPTLTWTKEVPDRATWYQVQIDNSAGTTVFDKWLPEADVTGIGTDPTIAGACSGSSCSATPASPLAAGDYLWRVRGRNPRGRSAFAAETAFTVATAVPSVTAAAYPAGDIFDTTPVYKWQASATASDYTLGGSIPATSTTGFVCGGGSCQVEPAVPVLAPGAYTWTVAPSNACGSASPSSALAFSVVSCGQAGPLENYTVTGSEVERDCDTVKVGNFGAGDYVVGASGDLTIHAGESIELHGGFSVLASGELVLIVDL